MTHFTTAETLSGLNTVPIPSSREYSEAVFLMRFPITGRLYYLERAPSQAEWVPGGLLPHPSLPFQRGFRVYQRDRFHCPDEYFYLLYLWVTPISTQIEKNPPEQGGEPRGGEG